MASGIERASSRNPEGLVIEQEKNAWRSVLDVEVDVKPFPDYLTLDVQKNLKGIGFELRYIPALNLGTIDDLREKEVKDYTYELQERYPNWKSSDLKKSPAHSDPPIARNLDDVYWKWVRDGKADFPSLPGQWLAVETAEKPKLHTEYENTEIARKLGFPDSRYKSWNDINATFESRKEGILSELGLDGNKADMRLLEALEWNLLGNREGWGNTTSAEWTNTENRQYVNRPARFIVGDSLLGGAAHIWRDFPEDSNRYKGFRVAIAFNSSESAGRK